MWYQYLLTGIIFAFCSFTDIKYRKIYGGVAAVYLLGSVAGHVFCKDLSFWWGAAGLLPGGFCFLLSWISRQELGYGDSMLITVCGVSLGLWDGLTVILTAFFLSGIWALLLILFGRAGRKKEIPFVPFLLLAVVIQGADVAMQQGGFL